MAIPTYSPGDVLTAADCNNWFTPIAAYKTATTNRSTLTLTADPDLTLSLDASSSYEIRAMVIYSGASGSFKFGWTVPASATGGYGVALPQGTPMPLGQTWGATPAGATDGTTYALIFAGNLITVGSSGSLTFKWGSNSGPASLTVGVGSYLLARRIG